MQHDQTPVNFDFINQQPAPEQKKGMQTKVKVLIVLLPLAILMLIASILFGGSQGETTVSQQDTIPVSDQFISAMSGDKEVYLEQAYPLLADSLRQDEAIAVAALERMYASVDFSTCTDGQKQTAGSIITASYACQTKNAEQVTLEVISDSKVIAYRVK